MVPVQGAIEIPEEPAGVRDIVRPFAPQIVTAHSVFLVELVVYLARILIHVGTTVTTDQNIVIDHIGKNWIRN